MVDDKEDLARRDLLWLGLPGGGRGEYCVWAVGGWDVGSRTGQIRGGGEAREHRDGDL